MTRKELQKEIKVRKGPNIVTYLPDDVILNTQRAFNISVTSPTGYGTTFGGAPEGNLLLLPDTAIVFHGLAANAVLLI